MFLTLGGHESRGGVKRMELAMSVPTEFTDRRISHIELQLFRLVTHIRKRRPITFTTLNNMNSS